MKIEESGSFDNIEKWLKKVINGDKSNVESFGKKVVDRLKSLTPVKSGKTANSWDYKVTSNGKAWELEIINTNINNGVSIAKILHYGHGTGTGGWVPGTHYITKAIDSIYQEQLDIILKDLMR